jgi:peptidoglycan/xylan/chitin deacetylase (PgdA/CDA1 family)
MKVRAPLSAGLPDTRELAVQALDRLWAALVRPEKLVSCGTAEGTKLALSFDDGPSAANTARVLDLLDEHGARGTFFVVGSRIRGQEEVLLRAAQSGHEIANHTYSHLHTVHFSRDELRREIVETNRVIAELLNGTGTPVRLVRPPFGKDRRRITAVASELGLLTVLWSIDSGDARGFTTSEVIEEVVEGATGGSIVLMHDGGSHRETTLTALASFLPRLRAFGFELTTVSDVLGLPAG